MQQSSQSSNRLSHENSINTSAQASNHPANMSTTISTRETYVDNLDNVLQLHEQLSGKLSALETASSSADRMISEARQSLSSKLTGTNVASTVGSGASIVGALLCFTPLAPFGAGLMLAGFGTSVGSSVANSFFFEKDAATAFTEALTQYNTSYNDMRNLSQQIEDGQEQLRASLELFVAEILSPPSGSGKISPTNLEMLAAPGGGLSSFSLAAFRGAVSGGSAAKPWLQGTKTATQLADWLGTSGGTIGQALGKTMPTLMGKALPIVSIAIDVVSIVSTWTGTNETLEKADKLKKEIQDGTEAYRERVRQYLAGLEELVGSPVLQDTLRKLMRLRNAVPGRPWGPPPPNDPDNVPGRPDPDNVPGRRRGPPPPNDPDMCCKMLNEMRGMLGVPLLIFASLLGQDNDDSTQNEYITEVVSEAQVVQLSEKDWTAPVIDSLYAGFPLIKPNDSNKKEDPQVLEAMMMIASFRLQCAFVAFGNKTVHNVSWSSFDKREPSWIGYFGWWVATAQIGQCVKSATLRNQAHRMSSTAIRSLAGTWNSRN
ncbi:hypothetical protein M758_1G141300 [Ceratodon purpureus]|nr:hypothetical protein M758_1G141300 [Ceratodon purpureus]